MTTMDSPFNAAWSKATWQLLLFLHKSYEVLDESGINLDDGKWSGDLDEGYGGIWFEARKPGNKFRYRDLWVGPYFDIDGHLMHGTPLYIECQTPDEALRSLLRAEFGHVVANDDDGWAIAIPWPLPASASNQEVAAAGAEFGRRILKVLTAK
jgi:hypothetical protein